MTTFGAEVSLKGGVCGTSHASSFLNGGYEHRWLLFLLPSYSFFLGPFLTSVKPGMLPCTPFRVYLSWVFIFHLPWRAPVDSHQALSRSSADCDWSKEISCACPTFVTFDANQSHLARIAHNWEITHISLACGYVREAFSQYLVDVKKSPGHCGLYSPQINRPGLSYKGSWPSQVWQPGMVALLHGFCVSSSLQVHALTSSDDGLGVTQGSLEEKK